MVKGVEIEDTLITCKEYEGPWGPKMEANMILSNESGAKLLECNGLEIEYGNMEISQIKECKFGLKCLKIEKDCPFYHNMCENKKMLIGNRDVQRKKKCWYQWSVCPFEDKCHFYHEKNDGQYDKPKNC